VIESFLASWTLFQHAYVAGWLIAMLLALLGVVVVTRDQIFLGAAVSQASVLGIAVAVCAGSLPIAAGCAWCDDDWTHTLAGGAFAVAGSLLAGTTRLERETHESLTGWVFLTSTCFAVLLLAHSPHGMDEINRLLASTIIGADFGDVAIFGAALGIVAAAIARWHAPLRLVLMDREMASAVGVRVDTWDRALAAALGAAIGLAIHVSGVIYSFGCLVLPALVAKNLCREVGQMFLVSPLVALAAAVAGFVLANAYDLPPGQAAVALLSVALVGAWIVRALRR
jgi:ABC-type Mn2+/Zn2+ transport system permease subunit